MSRTKVVGEIDEALGACNIGSLDRDRCSIYLDSDFDQALCVVWRSLLFALFEEVFDDRLDALEQFNKQVFVRGDGLTHEGKQGKHEEEIATCARVNGLNAVAILLKSCYDPTAHVSYRSGACISFVFRDKL